MSQSEIEQVHALVMAVRPLLTGQPSAVQAAALADLVATWLAGHVVVGDREATDNLRAVLLDDHMDDVRSLIESNAEILGPNM